jgi:divalent metal cation (Fe/Co/Zn/Cd) transporter
MSREEKKWDMQRMPTKGEHLFGVILSVLIFVLMTLFLYASVLSVMEKQVAKNGWVTLVVAGLLFIGSGYLLFRVVFSRRSKLGSRAILIAGYVVGAVSCLLLALTALGLSDNFYLAAGGFSGLAGSLAVIKQGRRGETS